jgi:hypothetical protein
MLKRGGVEEVDRHHLAFGSLMTDFASAEEVALALRSGTLLASNARSANSRGERRAESG